MGKLGQLVIELAANTARLESDMGKAVGVVERGARKITSAFKFVAGGAGGGLLASTLINAGREAINFGDNLNKAAIKAGVSGKAISELAYAAKLADVDLAALSTSIKKMQVSLSEAKSGAKGPTEALHALGLEVANLQGLKADQQFELIADRIAQLKDPADRTRAAVELFGKSGADLLPLFEKGAAGIREAREEAERLGLVFGDEQLKKLAEADDAIKRLDAAWQGLEVTLTAKVAPALTRVLNMASSGELAKRGKEAAFGPPALAAFRFARDVLGGGSSSNATSGQSGLGAIAASAVNRGQAPGFKAGPDASAIKAAAAAEKARIEGMVTAQERFNAELERTYQLNVEIENILADNAEAMGQAVEDVFEDIGKELEELPFEDTWEKKFQKIGEDFMQAFDNMVHNGKISWDEMLKYFVTQLVRSGIQELVSNIASGSSSGGGGGFWSSLFKSAAGSYGGARAAGGPVSAGKFYTVGERGPEILAAGAAGSIIPNRAMGSSIVVSPQYNIDARGATTDLVKALPKILRQNNEALKADIIEGSRRSRYPLGVVNG